MADGQLNLKPGVVITPIIPVFGQEWAKFKATLDYSSSSRLARANETLSQKIKNWKGEEKEKNTDLQKTPRSKCPPERNQTFCGI